MKTSSSALFSLVLVSAAATPFTEVAEAAERSQSTSDLTAQSGHRHRDAITTTVSPTATVTTPNIQSLPQFSQRLRSSFQLAQSITAANDGTGTVVNQTGNTFNITGGTNAGSNLFHSFEHLGLEAGQVANILSNPSITNILGRVTGGDPSVINGLLQVTGGNSNLFLMNPAGIIFGPESQVFVPGTFTATTAGGIQIEEDWFSAVGTNDYANLVGTPSGFAFTSPESGSIISAGNLNANSVTLLGGAIVHTGTIETPDGTITIASDPDQNLIRISQSGSLLSLELPIEVQSGLNAESSLLTAQDLPALLTGGAAPENLGIAVEDGVVKLTSTNTQIPTSAGTTIVAGTLDAATEAPNGTGGTIDVLGSQVALVAANLDASGTNGGGTVRVGGAYQGQGTLPTAEQTYISSGTTIAADALVRGDGGQVIVWANNTTEFYGNITARGGDVEGNGGFVEVSGHENLAFHGQVDVTAANGSYGTLLLDPQNIFIVGEDSAPDNNQLADGQILANEGGISDFVISRSVLEQQMGSIALQANGNIEIAPGVSLNLPGNAGSQADSITFQAGGDFLMDENAAIDAPGRSVRLSGVNVTVGDILGEQIIIKAASDGNLTTGNLQSNGIISLEADQGDVHTGNITVNPINFFVNRDSSTDLDFGLSSYTVNTVFEDGSEIFNVVLDPDDSLVNNLLFDTLSNTGTFISSTILNTDSPVYLPVASPRTPAVTIRTNNGFVRVEGDIAITATEVVFYGEDISGAPSSPIEPIAIPRNLLAIDHGGIPVDIGSGLSIGGGVQPFGLVVGSEADPGISVVSGQIQLQYNLEEFEIRQPNGSPSMFSGNTNEGFFVSPSSTGPSVNVGNPNTGNTGNPTFENNNVNQDTTNNIEVLTEIDTDFEKVEADLTTADLSEQVANEENQAESLCNAFRSTELLDVSAILPEECWAEE